MNKLQTYILEIVRYFDVFCKKHSIEYFIMGGSALGAARHKGFIPWDDDFDLFMTQDNYLRLVELKNEFENDRFCLQPINSPVNPLFMGKVRMKNTLLIEGNGDNYKKEICHGIYIDIMVLFDGCKTLFGRKKQFLFAKILSANRLSLDGYETKSLRKKVFTSFSNFLVKIMGREHFYKFIAKKRNSNYYCHLFGRAPYKKSFYPIEWFKGVIDTEFESLHLPLMQGYKEYLSLRYGCDYMKLPDKKTLQQYPSHASYVNYLSDTDTRLDNSIFGGGNK